jgi:hypothetical protein
MKNLRRSTFLLLWLSNLILQLHAQDFVLDDSFTLSQNGNPLHFPWSGGFNAPQFSTFDANLDGKKDLFVFDRQGGRISVFINTAITSGEISYTYAPQYISAFPPVLKNWVLLRDMNCDGKEDICANSGSGFKIYWNTSVNNLSFDWTITPNVPAHYDWGSSQTNSTVFSIAPDVPGIEDYDQDGDMDFWSWNEFSTSLFFYQNMAVENGDCLPDFECRNRCYGKFGESSESFTIAMGESFICDFNVVNPREEIQRHTGGTTLPIDLDQNGLLDLVIGDVTANSMTAILLDEGSMGIDSATIESPHFPAGFGEQMGVDMVTFLAGFYIDVNNDEIRDLVVASNANSDAEDRQGVWLYLNSGWNDAPVFTLYSQRFLQEDMLDVGTCAFPELADVDADGLIDLVVGNRKYFVSGSPNATSLNFLRNVGSADVPAFERIDDNWLSVSSWGIQAAFPCFQDADADGDQDLFIGDLSGRILQVNRLSNGTDANAFEPLGWLLDSAGDTIDVGQFASPQWFDVDGDSIQDLVSGCLNGSVWWFRGTDQGLQFMTDSLGGAIATSILGIQGRSIPKFYHQENGEIQMLLGSETGTISLYDQISSQLNGTFHLVTPQFETIDVGERSAPAMADMNGDGLLDLAVGNLDGGLQWYRHLPLGIPRWERGQLAVYPSPANDVVFLRWEENSFGSTWKVVDIMGREIEQGSVQNTLQSIDVSAWNSGCYVICSAHPNGNITMTRFLVTH